MLENSCDNFHLNSFELNSLFVKPEICLQFYCTLTLAPHILLPVSLTENCCARYYLPSQITKDCNAYQSPETCGKLHEKCTQCF